MKVKTLIKILEKMPPDSDVLVPGYEGGYSDVIVKGVKEMKVVRNANSREKWWEGRHEDARYARRRGKKPAARSVLISHGG